jgi:hypothetical protein
MQYVANLHAARCKTAGSRCSLFFVNGVENPVCCDTSKGLVSILSHRHIYILPDSIWPKLFSKGFKSNLNVV